MENYMSITGRYIYITPNYKLINPTHDAPIFKYSGPIEGFNLKNQTKNFNEIQNKLKDNPLTYIFVGKFVGNERIKTTFLAHTNDRKYWWYKYEGKAEGDSSNVIIVDGKKYRLSKWLKTI